MFLSCTEDGISEKETFIKKHLKLTWKIKHHLYNNDIALSSCVLINETGILVY